MSEEGFMRALQSPRGRYLGIGVSVYLLELLVIVAAQRLGASSVMAVALAFWTGLVVSFGLQKLVTFDDKRTHRKILLRQVFLFSLLVLFNFMFTILFTSLFAAALPAVVCRTLALGITTIWNFYLYKSHIFSKSTAKKTAKTPAQQLVKKFKRQRKQASRSYRRWRKLPSIKRLRAVSAQPGFGKWYLAVCLAVLLITTLLWSWLGAQLQQTNADQLVNAYLFNDSATFHGAAFPSQHSFVLKWPLFYAIKLFGYTDASFIAATIGCVMATVAVFVYILSRIERRPLPLGTICLLLASVLLLVPAQPYAGGLLPVNMAMLTTRNLEYLLYIGSLACLIRAPRLRSWYFLGSVVLLTLLVASDQLFLSLSVGGSLLAIVAYSLQQRWQLVTVAVRWLLASAAAGIGSLAALAVINQAHVANIIGKAVSGPYRAVDSAHTTIVGLVYGVGGVLANFGANPAYDALTIRQIAHTVIGRMFSVAGPAYLFNFWLFLLVAAIGINLMVHSFRGPQKGQDPASQTSQLAIVLVWSAVAVFGLFIATNHYYQVDARYLTVFVFAGFVVLANWLCARRVDAALVLLGLPLLLIILLCGAIAAVQTYGHQKQAYTSLNYRNLLVAQSLRSHHADVLVGDYWRVLPIKSLAGGNRQMVLPLGACGEPRTVLTSRVWQPNLGRHSVAYLLTLDGSLTDYRGCTLSQVVKTYGLPNNSVLIDGTLSRPSEVLLFYDRGVHPSRKPSAAAQAPATVLPIPLAEVPHAICDAPTIMNVVAHEDDDLLFLNPDLLHSIAAKQCVRSIYLTAGDAGSGQQYWLSRELGSEAAYSAMLGSSSIWIHRVVALPGGQFITIASPKGNDQVSLIFMHLPDGNIGGDGFSASHHQSLAELEAGSIGSLRAVDEQSRYSAVQLTEALINLMHTYQPAEIRTQSGFRGSVFTDHSDHMATGRFAGRAHDQYEIRQYAGNVKVPLRYYLGYPIHEHEPNVSPQDLALKQAAFLAYAHFDGGVCRGAAQQPCQEAAVYQAYLERQYQYAY